jgi:hypothetical protein
MKKLTFFLVFLLFGTSLFAQTYLAVTPGYGTLNAAVTAHQGNVIYQLQAGGWYLLNGQIENAGFPLTIVGTTPAAGQMPAVIQTATNPDGTVLTDMFSVLGNFYMKNVFIVNADANNNIGQGVFSCNDTTSLRFVLDSVTVDPVGTNHLYFGSTPFPEIYITNSLFLRMGVLTGANDWCIVSIRGTTTNAADTLYMENNTFISTGTHIYIPYSSYADEENFVWINHNTFAFHKSGLIEGTYMNSYFITNNLFFDFNTQPFDFSWLAYSVDGTSAGYTELIEQDTVPSGWDRILADTVNGELNSPRKLFAEYNSEYLSPKIQAYLTTWAPAHTLNNDGITALAPAYFRELALPLPDSANAWREGHMLNDSHFPHMLFGNFMNNMLEANTGTDVGDPQWTDPRLYTCEDSLISWTLPAMELSNWGFNATSVPVQPINSGNWYWCADSVYNWGSPVVWPRVNASYTNKTMLTASIEGMPLGDLNWFPAQKALWVKNQSAIMSHILDENTSPMTVTAVTKTGNKLPFSFSLSQNFPNPFNPTTMIQYSIPKSGIVTLKVYNVLGQEVATLVNQQQQAGNYNVSFDATRLASGVYMYKIQSGSFTSTKKMLLLK